ncbi:MAG: amino acid adenylation domain-containing protein, partial [Caldilineaceae bacterium]|nr:amino acid adenylation domain-containing protein [Caldilineaceae bacterium]
GGVHVPLDPSFPTERLAYMMQDAQIALLLTQETLASSFANQSTPLICLDSAWPQIAQNKDKNPTTPVKPHQLAYIIYTSGSTGQPKGVMVDHAALAGHIDTVIDLYNVTSADRVLQFAAITFDVALEQIFLALGSGATLVMRGTDLWTPPEFDQQVLDHAITVADLPPVYFHQLVQYWQTARPTFLAGQLRLILVGGEKTTPETVKLWQELGAVGTKLLNAYGPTETTITAAICDLSAYPLAETTSALSNLPIGRPLPNRSVYILDIHLQPTPIGVPGELYIGGAGLAHGYLNKPALTTENFIPNPFAPSERPGRLYRTGDLVRWIAEPDGSEENSPIIEFLGRVDHQVKIRGFRIEPGEIEAVLTQHPEVQEAVVVAQGNQSNEQQLVAYVILDIIIDESNPQLSSALSQYLQQTLPAYMIPAHFVVLDALPMTPAGKIDRGSLPAPKPTSSTVAHKSPDTETEEILAAIWRELLNLQAISIHDNFFHHGGNSILSLQFVSHTHRAGLQLQPKDIFLYPTIAQLARIVGQDTETSAPQIAADPVTGSAPLTPIQQWFFDHHTIDIHHHNQSMIFALRPGLDVVCLQQALQQLLDHHDALRTRFIPTDNGWQQLYLSDDKLSFHQIDLARLSAPEQTQCLATEADRLQASLNLTAGPLMEVALFTYGTD